MTSPETAVEKRKVVMTNAIAVSADVVHTHVATDYVPVDQLDEYVADAKTRWQLVEVGTEPDSGPAPVEETPTGE